MASHHERDLKPPAELNISPLVTPFLFFCLSRPGEGTGKRTAMPSTAAMIGTLTARIPLHSPSRYRHCRAPSASRRMMSLMSAPASLC